MNETYYIATLTRGMIDHESVLIKENLSEWLNRHRAKPTKRPNRFTIKGWRCCIEKASAEKVALMEKELNKKY